MALSTFPPLVYQIWLVVDLRWEYVSAIQIPGKGCVDDLKKRASAWLISDVGSGGARRTGSLILFNGPCLDEPTRKTRIQFFRSRTIQVVYVDQRGNVDAFFFLQD